MGSCSNREETRAEMIGRFAKDISSTRDTSTPDWQSEHGAEIRGKLGIEKGNQFIAAIAKAKAEGKSFDEWVKGQENYLYHGTNEDVLENITKKGLEPGRRGQLSLSKTEEYAKSFAGEGITPKGKTRAIIFRVKPSDLKMKTTLKRIDGKTRPLSDQLNEILTKETISPELLEISKDGGKTWENLITGELAKTKSQLKQLRNKGEKTSITDDIAKAKEVK